tara:strand:- start:215 stop:382 length:168 start_codon:yes stop_codon:yes gene_type:complete
VVFILKIARYIISLLCLTAAVGFYSFGLAKGGAIFLALGLSFEAAFWYGLFSKRD